MSARENGGGRPSRFSSAGKATRPPTEPLYLPPHKVAALELSAASREERQRLAWERLRKQVHGVVNRVNAGNAADCVLELLQLNLVRGMGLFVRSLLRAQVVSQNFSPVYAAVVAAVNARLPEVGELLLGRIVAQLKRGMDEKDRGVCLASVKFIAHLLNQSVVDALLPLEIMNVLATAPSNDSIELLVAFIKECGPLLHETEPRMLDDLFQLLRTVVQEGEVSTRVQYLVEGLLTIRRTQFANGSPMPQGLDLIPDEDRIVHNVSFAEPLDQQLGLDAFCFDDQWEEAEMRYAEFRIQVIGEEDDMFFEEITTALAGEEEYEDKDLMGARNIVVDVANGAAPVADANAKKVDMTEEDLVTFRRKVYLQIMSAVSFEECAHKLVQFMRGYRGHEAELCNMVIECCSQERTFMRYYGLIGKQFCMLDRVYVARFEEAFAAHYSTIHQFDSRKIRNMANFYAFLLCGDALPFSIFGVVVLCEEETTSSSRIFLKYLFLEMAHTLTVPDLDKRFQDERLQPYLSGVFPSEAPATLRFAINFFTAIGLGPLTDGMRARLREIPNQKAAENMDEKPEVPVSSSSSSLSSSSDSSSSLSASSHSEYGDERSRHGAGHDNDRYQAERGENDARHENESDHRYRDNLDGSSRKRQLSRNARASPQRKHPRHSLEDDNGRFDLRAGRGRGRGRRRDFGAGPPPGSLGRGRGRGGQLTVPAWVKQLGSRAQDISHTPRLGTAPDAAEGGETTGRRRSRSPNESRSRRRRRSVSMSPPRYRDWSPPRSPSRSPRRSFSRSPDDRYRHRAHSPDHEFAGGRGRRRSPAREEKYRSRDEGEDRRREHRDRSASPDDRRLERHGRERGNRHMEGKDRGRERGRYNSKEEWRGGR